MKGRVLVTGAAGFLGSNLIPQLLKKGYTVAGLDNLCLGNRERIDAYTGENFTFIPGDVCDPAAVLGAADGVEHIVHFAELKIPRYTSSFETLEVNVAGTENVCRLPYNKKPGSFLDPPTKYTERIWRARFMKKVLSCWDRQI
jgi:nucleoside-diphosphate-sugar epimerase